MNAAILRAPGAVRVPAARTSRVSKSSRTRVGNFVRLFLVLFFVVLFREWLFFLAALAGALTAPMVSVPPGRRALAAGDRAPPAHPTFADGPDSRGPCPQWVPPRAARPAWARPDPPACRSGR